MILLGISITSVNGAEELAGSIDVDVKDWIGVVYPSINIDNQSVTFIVNVTNVDNVTKYKAKDKLLIELNINNNRGYDQFFFPRSLSYCAIKMRKILDIKMLPPIGIINRLFPVVELFKSVNVVNSTVAGCKNNNISIPLSYSISEEAYNNDGENFTLFFYAMDLIPGNTNGISEEIPIVISEKIELQVIFQDII